jgi:hypothetical protein
MHARIRPDFARKQGGREVYNENHTDCSRRKASEAADIAARRQEVSRSARIRQALQEHLKRLHVAELDARHQPGYQARPQRLEEYRPWEETAAWPQE